jgi:hypothetical protein
VSASVLQPLVLGIIAALCFVAGLYFYRYWRSTRDRFFLFFMAAFWIEGVNRLAVGLTGRWNEDSPFHYLVRLVSYALILLAIVDKNRPRR